MYRKEYKIMNVVLYTTHCPKCEVLKKKLDNADIEYQIEEDVDVMTDKGFLSAPMLEVDDKIMDFSEAVKWVNSSFSEENVECESCKVN